MFVFASFENFSSPQTLEMIQDCFDSNHENLFGSF